MRTAERRTAGSAGLEASRPRGAPALGHRAGLDGLRGLAVVAVIGYHTGILRSGWIGVDVFFALSGYLITGLLLAELDGTGTIGLRRFWTRRLRRLLPGLVLLLGFVALLGTLGLPGWKAPQLGDVVGAATYSSNWLRIAAQSSYWDLFRTPGPLEHVWSLAVEEQFYVVWPILVFLVGRRHRRLVLPLAVGMLLLTSGTQLWLGFHGAAVERMYVGTDTRAPAFLLGALLVMTLDRRGAIARWAAYTVPVGIAWLLTASVVLDGQSRWTYHGLLLAVSALGAFTVLGAARLDGDSPIGRFLGSVPLQRIGRWSYGIYLFHWPVAVALRSQQMLGVQRFVLVMAIATALAAASYEILEHPIRRVGVPVRWRIPALACSTAILLAACGNVSHAEGRQMDAETRAQLLSPLGDGGGAAGAAAGRGGIVTVGPSSGTEVAPGSTGSGGGATTIGPPNGTTAASTTAAGSTSGHRTDSADRSSGDTDPPAVPGSVNASTPGDPASVAVAGPVTSSGDASAATPDDAIPVAVSGSHLLVLGDSVPFQMAQRLTAAAQQRGITAALRAAPGCTPSDDPADHYRDSTRDICAFVQSNLAQDLTSFHPDVVLVYYGLAGSKVYSHGALDACGAGKSALTAQLTRILDLAQGVGAVLRLVPPADPPQVAWLDSANEAAGAVCYRDAYSSFAAAHPDTVKLVRVDEFVCPTGPEACPAEIDGVEMRYDGIHFSQPGSDKVIPWILDRLYR